MTGACILLVLFVGIFVGLLVALTPFTLFLTIPFIIAFSGTACSVGAHLFV